MKNFILLFILLIGVTFSNKLFAENKNTKQFTVKALYLSDSAINNMVRLQHYIDLTKRSEINSYVIDLKGVEGIVNYESKIPAVRKAKACAISFNLGKVINAFHQNSIHVIGRIVCFKDPYLSVQKPEWAVKRMTVNFTTRNG